MQFCRMHNDILEFGRLSCCNTAVSNCNRCSNCPEKGDLQMARLVGNNSDPNILVQRLCPNTEAAQSRSNPKETRKSLGS